MDKKDLLDLINDDDLGLLDAEKNSVSATPDDRLLESFVEINEFFSVHKTEPKTGGEIHEHKLASRLKHIRENKEQRDFLSKDDTHGLLKTEKKDLDTVSDIFEDDDLDLLSIEDSSVFNIKNVPNNQPRSTPEFIARRSICKDFGNFEELFTKCHENLKTGLFVFCELEKHLQVQAGTFFVLGGLLGYVQRTDDFEINEQSKINGRLRIIFENGTESSMLLQSLVRSLQKEGGKLVCLNDNKDIEIVSDDNETGYIYVIKSLSADPKINSIKNLYKIGFSTTMVEQRIQNAEKDPTYLIAPVSIVATYRCFNMNPQRFERLIHRFFSDSCLDIEITDNNGKKYTPKEWFIVPMLVIGKVIELIIKGEIVNYSYDKENELIIKKE